ncbi:protein rep [Microbacterium suwonense]|uniref:Replication protein n=1 Tax=Microbacterium suwonense TaxID=683047 RepID=A0ABM8FRH1_9MICO|nr:protein rep [Microbacterium suwonense]BDZ38070.1 hypothetical protein GCM10025863_06840 [Microbacterium suwonense]
MAVRFGGDASASAGLGTHAKSVTRSRDFRALRRLRFARRAQSSAWLLADSADLHGEGPASRELAPRVAKCGWAIAAGVGVHKREGGAARFSGVAHCGSIWGCPTCSAVIRNRRAEEVTAASEWWRGERDGAFLFVTFTARHKMGDPLKDSLSALTGAFTRLIRGAPWKRFAARMGIAHMIKAVEVTLSWRNGWHAHLHVLWFTDREASRSALEDAQGWLAARWADMVVKEGGRRPDDVHGVNVRRVQDGRIVSQYLTKLQEAEPDRPRGWDLAAEMTRIDSKKGRLESLVPFDLLDVDGMSEEEQQRAREHWAEFVAVTKGRRAMTWSRGLKDAAGIDELDDDEIVAEAEPSAEDDDLVVVIHRRDWMRMQHDPDKVARVLELVEQGRLDELLSVVAFMYPAEAHARE